MPAVSIPATSAIRFTHPRVNGGRSLVIDTGANSIGWNYGLNTRVDPTYAGEVVQILSCYVDALQITGQTRDNTQLREIYDFFQEYMERAGLFHRDERAVLFEYPERGWSFWIQPTQAPGYKYGTTLIATEWSVTAEVQQDDPDINSLAQHTMSNFTTSLFDDTMFNIGFKNFDPRNDPNGYPGPAFGKGFADNFQALLGAWAGGDFGHWGFSVLNDPAANKLPENVRDYWTQLVGTNLIAGGQDTTGNVGGSTVLGGPNPTTDLGIVNLIKFEFESKNVPAVIGVTVALIESALDPNARTNPASVGLFQPQVPPFVGRVNQNFGHFLELKQAAQHRNDNIPNPITKYYSVEAQCEDAAGWFSNPSYVDRNDYAQWAINAQGQTGHAASYRASYNRFLPQAQRYLKQLSNENIARTAVVQFAKSGVQGFQGKLGYSAKGRPATQFGTAGNWQQVKNQGGTDCSGFVEICFYWGTAGDNRMDPMGATNRYSGAFSGTMQSSSNGTTIALKDVKPGDLAVYGNDHVAMFVDSGNTVVSHGSPAGPHLVKLSDESAAQKIAPTYRSFLG